MCFRVGRRSAGTPRFRVANRSRALRTVLPPFGENCAACERASCIRIRVRKTNGFKRVSCLPRLFRAKCVPRKERFATPRGLPHTLSNFYSSSSNRERSQIRKNLSFIFRSFFISRIQIAKNQYVYELFFNNFLTYIYIYVKIFACVSFTSISE